MDPQQTTAGACLRIAGVTLQAHSGEQGLHLHVPAPDDRFQCPGFVAVPDYQLEVSTVPDSPAGRGEVLFSSGGLWRLLQDGRLLHLELSGRQPGRPSRCLVLDMQQGTGELRIQRVPSRHVTVRPDGCTVDPFHYPLSQLLVYWRLPSVGGLGMHAAGVAVGGRGVLLPGVSGSGKSTISRLMDQAGHHVLSDDRAALLGTDQGFQVCGTPWQGDACFASPASAPLSAVLLLEHGERNELLPLSATGACAELLARSCPPLFSRELMERVGDLCARIAQSVPCYRLRFVPDASVVATVEKLIA